MYHKGKVSIIVPVYRVEGYLPHCVESILAQSYENIEVILVDDGSPDSCPELCDLYAQKDSRVLVLHRSNQGVSAARNAGISLASGEYILFVDSDDWIAKDMVECMLSRLNCVGADVCVCRFAYVCSDDEVASERLDTYVSYGATEFLEHILIDPECRGYAANKLFRRTILGSLKFNEDVHFCEDMLFYVQLATRCSVIVQLDARLYFYRTKSPEERDRFSERRCSAVKAYEMMMPIYEKYAPYLMPTFKKRFLLVHINLKSLIKKNHITNKGCMKFLDAGAAKAMQLVASERRISLLDKVNLFLTWLLPETMRRLRPFLHRLKLLLNV